MKELYIKPMIAFESFSLSQTIARNCGDTHTGTTGQSNHYNEATCEWEFGQNIKTKVFFMSDGGRCDDGPWDDEEEWSAEGICYNNPDGGKAIFSST